MTKRISDPLRSRHGMHGARIYKTWEGMLSRCTNPRSTGWKKYGARGIKVCERWLNFRNFYADMGDAPTGRTLDRIDNNGNYEPGNVRWATPKEQQTNKRTTVYLEQDGLKLTIGEWADRLGIPAQRIYCRRHRGKDLSNVLRGKDSHD